MKITKIVILVPHGVDLTPADNAVLSSVLRDSLAEFVNHRTPCAAYVAKRYEGDPHLATSAKVEEVRRRAIMAAKVLAGVHNSVEVTVTDDGEGSA